MNFQSIVLLIACIVLIGSLIMIGLALKNVNKDVKFPPIVSECPDYWQNVSPDGESGLCENTNNLGTISDTCSSIPNSMDFSVAPYVGAEGLCEKKTWANNCNLTWDGITNNSKVCNEQTS
tara:strand:- start:9040 stop:9402 length:363 start_codon:yes stop_codon:yes gene_type:complete